MSDSRVQRVSDHVVWFTPDERTDRPSLALVSGSRSTVLLEVGASPDHTLSFLHAADALNLPALRAAVLTHWHWDHSFGGSVLNIPIIGQRETHAELVHQSSLDWSDQALDKRVAAGTEIEFCRDMIKLELPDRSALKIVPPQIVFDDRLTLDLGGVVCTVEHVGGDHAADSAVIYVTPDNVLLLGDAHYQRLYAERHHYTAAKLIPLLDRLEAFGATTMIGGHDDELFTASSFSAFASERRHALELVRNKGEAALAGTTGDEQELVQFMLNGLG